jgi:phage terminase Nu1 subunit (DNA packaging protein)
MATSGDTRQTQATMPAPDDLLTTAELADALKVNERTVRRWRNERTGPPVLWAGGHARYRWRDVLEWLERRRAPEDEPPPE